MAKKTIHDPLEAIVTLRTALKILSKTADALDATVARVPRPELTHFRAALATALEVYDDTLEYVQPSIADNLKPAEIGNALYGWFICNASFAEKVQARELQARMHAFLTTQLERWPNSADQLQIQKGFWDADDERFGNDAALGRDVNALEEVLTERYADAKPNSDCTLEVWAQSAIIRLEASIKEASLIPNLLTVTDEDNGVVTLEFTDEGAAANFVMSTDPTAEYEELSSTARATIDNNRTLRNAEANEGKPYFKYAIGSVMSANSGFPTLPITKRLVAEDGSIWYMLGRGAEHTSRSEFDLDRDWECTSKVPTQPEWRYSKRATFTRRQGRSCAYSRVIVRRRVLDEHSAPAYLLEGIETGYEFFMTESALDANYVRQD